MSSPAGAARTVRFGLFELDLHTGELRRKGARVALQEQPFRVLSLLVAQPGELVTRDALRRALWAEDVFVDVDHGLNKAVAKVRDALGDLAESPRYVETLERRGYRFIAPVEVVASPATPAPAPGRADHAVLARLSWNGQSHPLDEGEYVIGRDPSAAFWTTSSLVSRRHARLVVSASAVTVEDLDSRNGTFVNGQRLREPFVPAPLVSGDEIRIGPDRFIVVIPTGADSTVSVRAE
jgi:DNA-binding winged helix-turn-helix (wHTH) protein